MKILFKLTRIPLSLAISFSALAGFIFYKSLLNDKAVMTFIGIFLLSGGASVLNQFQERRQDAIMNRTKNRPLPLKQIKPGTALLISLIFISAGTAVLLFGTVPAAAILGLINLFCYNAVYTPLKTKSRFAVLAGALTGFIPPLTGWIAAGGPFPSIKIIIVSLFMYAWQIPHFLLLLMKYGDEYELAGFPSLFKKSGNSDVKSVIFLWILSTSVIAMIFPFFNIVSGIFPVSILTVLNFLFIYYFYRILFLKINALNVTDASRSIYLYQALILFILILQPII